MYVLNARLKTKFAMFEERTRECTLMYRPWVYGTGTAVHIPDSGEQPACIEISFAALLASMYCK